MTIAPPAPQTRTPTAPRARVAAPGIAATAGQRAGAYLIDIAVVAVAAAAVWFLTGSLVLVAVTVLELWAIGWIWEGHTGATPGNLACGIRTVQRDGDVSVGARGLFLRSLVMGAAHVIPVLLPVGLAGAGALDGLARSRMIDVRRTRAAAANGTAPALDLEARITGPDAGAATISPPPGVITQTPLTTPPAAVAAPDPVEAGSIPVFELSDGSIVEASGLGYIGRAPRAPETIPDAILIRVPDGTRSLSRTHAAFGVEDDKLWVQDLGSANGAGVRHPGGGLTELVAHTPFFLVPGDVLVLGGDVDLSYRRVAGRGARPAAAEAPQVPTASERLAPPAPAPAIEQSAPQASPAPSAPPAGQAAPGTRAAARLAQVDTPPAVEPAAPAPASAQAPVAPPTTATPAAPSPAPAPAPAPPRVAPASVALQFVDGTTVPITGVGYIGRAPRLPEGEHPDALLVPVPDGDRSVSRTHGRFGIVDGQAWFEDLGSGNGSSLHLADGRSGPMTPHQRFGLTPGMTLQIGDCLVRVLSV